MRIEIARNNNIPCADQVECFYYNEMEAATWSAVNCSHVLWRIYES